MRRELLAAKRIYAPSMGVGLHTGVSIERRDSSEVGGRRLQLRLNSCLEWLATGTGRRRRVNRHLMGRLPSGSILAFVPLTTTVSLASLKSGSQDALSALPSFEDAVGLLQSKVSATDAPAAVSAWDFLQRQNEQTDLMPHFEEAVLSHFVALEVSRNNTYPSTDGSTGMCCQPLARWWGHALPSTSQLARLSGEGALGEEGAVVDDARRAAQVSRAAVLGVYRSRLGRTSADGDRFVCPTAASHTAALHYLTTSSVLMQESEDGVEGTQMSLVPVVDLLTNVVLPPLDTAGGDWVPVEGNVRVEMTTAASIREGFGYGAPRGCGRIRRSRRGVAAPPAPNRSFKQRARLLLRPSAASWWWAVSHGRRSFAILNSPVCWVSRRKRSGDEQSAAGCPLAGVVGGKHRLLFGSNPEDIYLVISATRDIAADEVLLLNGMVRGAHPDPSSTVGGHSEGDEGHITPAERLVRHGLV